MRFRSIFLGKNKISRRPNFSKLPYDTVCTANERFSQNLQPQNRKNHMAAIIEEEKSFPGDFIKFMNEACTAYHAVNSSKELLLGSGFVEISEQSKWDIQRGGKYFFVRNGTCLIAFIIGSNYEAGNGFTVVGAHTDSPCLRIKPVHCSVKADALVLNTQPYGGGLWHTWFDRDLGLAGRVLVRESDGSIYTKLVRVDRAVARIPNLAIHLQSASEREAFSPNLHEHAKAILTMDPDMVNMSAYQNSPFNPCLLRLISTECQVNPEDIIDMELQLIDLQPSTLGGASGELVISGRLDNLCSTYQCVRAIISASTMESPSLAYNVQMALLFDHEEVGSNSSTGAGSSIFMDSLRLIDAHFTKDAPHTLNQALRKSLVVSIDMAHAHHPNYPSKHDPCMAPKINKGLVVKHNCNQRYATSSVSATMFREFARIEDIPIQEFSVRADAACGSAHHFNFERYSDGRRGQSPILYAQHSRNDGRSRRVYWIPPPQGHIRSPHGGGDQNDFLEGKGKRKVADERYQSCSVLKNILVKYS